MRSVAFAALILATLTAFAKTPRLSPAAYDPTPSTAKASAKKLAKKSAKKKKSVAPPVETAAQAPVAVVQAPVAIRAVQIDPAVAIAPSYSTEDEKLQAVLSFVYFNDARKYGWPSNYTAMWCPTNAFHLLKRLQQAGVDLSDAEVWYLIPPEEATGSGDSTIHPRLARPIGATTVSEWAFHVVIQVHGRILDLDFKAQPEVLLQVQYAAQMWQKGPLARPSEDARALYVRRIPATDYLTQYAENWDYYVSGGGGRYPAVEMSSLFPRVTADAAQ